VEEIIQDYQIVLFGEREARACGKCVDTLDRPVPVLESLIAATPFASDLELVMGNSDDFPGVSAINPAKP